MHSPIGMSPALLSMAKSSFSVPMNVSPGSGALDGQRSRDGSADVCASAAPRLPRTVRCTHRDRSAAGLVLSRIPRQPSSRRHRNRRSGDATTPCAPARRSVSRSAHHRQRTGQSVAPPRPGRIVLSGASSSPRRIERRSAAHSIGMSRGAKQAALRRPLMVWPDRPTRGGGGDDSEGRLANKVDVTDGSSSETPSHQCSADRTSAASPHQPFSFDKLP